MSWLHIQNWLSLSPTSETRVLFTPQTPAATKQSVLKQLEQPPRVREGRRREEQERESSREQRKCENEKTGRRTGMETKEQSVTEFVVINNQFLVNTEMRACKGTRVSSLCQNRKGKLPHSRTPWVNRAEPERDAEMWRVTEKDRQR